MNDVRLALRMMVTRPGMSALAIVALAVGIGLTTIMFSIVNGVLLRGLPFEESDRIYHFSRQPAARTNDQKGTLHDFVDWSARQQSFEPLSGFRTLTMNVVGPDGTPVRYSGCAMSANTLRTLRARPVLGRDFRDEDGRPGAEPVAIISDTVWLERFDRAPTAIGASLRLNGTPTTVVGVMAPRFKFPEAQELWIPQIVDAPPAARATSVEMSIIGRLRDDASLTQARAELSTIARQLETEYPDTNKGMGVRVQTYLDEFIGPQPRRTLTAMMAAVLGVLIIACANVANLTLARAADRTREIAVRTALGANRGRVIRQMLIEVLVLAVAGAALGLGIAQVGVGMFMRAIADTQPPFWIDVRLDQTVLLFVTGVTVLATAASGLWPALRASRTELAAVMKDEGRSTSLRLGRVTRMLVVAEMALSFGLLVASALVIQSVVNAGRQEIGFDASHIWRGTVTLVESDYPTDERRRQFMDALLPRLQALPGLQGAALATYMPPQGPTTPIKFPGQTYENDRAYPRARGVTVSPGFFATLGVGVEGRVFDERDRENAPAAAIVSRAFAKKFFPGGAMGQSFALARGDHQEWRTIVGVVPDIAVAHLAPDETPETYFLALAQAPASVFSIALRTAGPALEITAAARDAVRAVDPNMPVWRVNSLEQALYDSNWPLRVFGSLFTAFGFAALLLTTVGLYGVMAFSVSRRTQEVGVRMAMGARGRDVLTMVLRQGLVQVAVGMVIGVGLGAGLGSAMSALLVNVSPYDGRIFLAVALVLTATAIAACIVPARRAAALDPMVALRRQ